MSKDLMPCDIDVSCVPAPARLGDVLQSGTIIFSLSGGKDSDAMTRYWLPKLRQRYPDHRYVAIHADLGRAEWSITHRYVTKFCEEMNLELHIVKHSKRDLLDGIRHRMATRPEVPPWPSAAARYCTSDWKRGPISKWIRNNTNGNVAVLMGFRADESPARAKRPIVSFREDCCAPTKGRTVYDVLPIHALSEKDVWDTLGYSLEELESWRRVTRRFLNEGKSHADMSALLMDDWFDAHPAYAYGNQRLSCALCVLGSVNDLANGAENDPELYQAFCDIEMESGYSFRKGFWLGCVRPELLREDQMEFYAEKFWELS